MLTPSTVNSDIFVLFVDRLKEWIEEWNRFDYANVILILDNWPFHRSSKSKQKLRELGYLVAFLPQYSPQLAPVELAFSIVKRQLKNQTKSRGLNLSEMSNYGEFRSSMKELDKDRVRSFYKEFLQSVKTMHILVITQMSIDIGWELLPPFCILFNIE